MTSRCFVPGCKKLLTVSGDSRALFSWGMWKEIWLFVLMAIGAIRCRNSLWSFHSGHGHGRHRADSHLRLLRYLKYSVPRCRHDGSFPPSMQISAHMCQWVSGSSPISCRAALPRSAWMSGLGLSGMSLLCRLLQPMKRRG